MRRGVGHATPNLNLNPNPNPRSNPIPDPNPTPTPNPNPNQVSGMLPLEQLLVPSRELVGEVSAEIEPPTVAAPATYCCSPCHLLLQPMSPTVAGPATYGCSRFHLRLQVSVEIKCVSLRAGRASLQVSPTPTPTPTPTPNPTPTPTPNPNPK